MNEDLVFRDEPNIETAAAPLNWIVLIVDDEREVHTVTEMALSDFQFQGRHLHFLHAYSAKEAKAMLSEQTNIALILLDVVMETDNAGLSVVEYVRNELKNNFVRIILRTGQPGQAPELEVISRYDINDYKNKTELTRTRLFTTVHTSLATYRDLIALDAHRRGLEKVIEASAHIFEMRSMSHFTQGVLEQLAALLFLGNDAVIIHPSGIAAEDKAILKIMAATGAYSPLLGQDARAVLPGRVVARIVETRKTDQAIYGPDYFARHQCNGAELIFYIDAEAPVSVPDRRLVDLFCQNVSIAYKNMTLLQKLVSPGSEDGE